MILTGVDPAPRWMRARTAPALPHVHEEVRVRGVVVDAHVSSGRDSGEGTGEYRGRKPRRERGMDVLFGEVRTARSFYAVGLCVSHRREREARETIPLVGRRRGARTKGPLWVVRGRELPGLPPVQVCGNISFISFILAIPHLPSHN